MVKLLQFKFYKRNGISGGRESGIASRQDPTGAGGGQHHNSSLQLQLRYTIVLVKLNGK